MNMYNHRKSLEKYVSIVDLKHEISPNKNKSKIATVFFF